MLRCLFCKLTMGDYRAVPRFTCSMLACCIRI